MTKIHRAKMKVTNRKKFDISTEKGMESAERYKELLYKKHNHVRTEVVGIDKIELSIYEEGEERTYNVNRNIGHAKYVVNFHDGEKTYDDGSKFYDIKIFKNKKDLANFESDLIKKGYRKKNS